MEDFFDPGGVWRARPRAITRRIYARTGEGRVPVLRAGILRELHPIRRIRHHRIRLDVGEDLAAIPVIDGDAVLLIVELQNGV